MDVSAAITMVVQMQLSQQTQLAMDYMAATLTITSFTFICLFLSDDCFLWADQRLEIRMYAIVVAIARF